MKAFRVWLMMVLAMFSAPAMMQAQTTDLFHTVYEPTHSRGTIRFYLVDMAKRTGLQFSYSDALLKRHRTVTLSGNEHDIGAVLRTILAGTGINAVERNGKILLVQASGEPQKAAMVTISGFVKDSASREVLIGAVVYVPSLNTGITSNTYGYYSLSLPAGSYDIVTSSIAYRADTTHLAVSNDLRRDVLLPYGMNLAGITVSSQKEASSDHIHLGIKSLYAHAGLLGENDVMRALQYQTGVQGGTEGSSSVLVRGGDPGQNLNLLDGVPLYYVDHFYGVTSIFNTDAVKSVDFYKGAFPSRYGGRLSSIIDVSSRDGNMERLSGQASLGLLKGSLTLESPIVKDKASVMFSARRTWADVLWRPFADNFGIDFYDINAKVNCLLNKNNRVYASFYTGRDQFRVQFDETDSRALWGNTIGSFRWTSVLNPKLFITTTAAYSYFRYQVNEEDPYALPDSSGVRPHYKGTTAIYDLSLRVQADYFINSAHHLQFGAQYASADFSPATISYDQSLSALSAASFRSNELIVYAEDEIRLSPKLTLRPGLHFANWLSDSYHYNNLQPRLYISWRPAAGQNIYGSVTRMSQFLHFISSNTSLLPTDFWIPSTARIVPEYSWLYAAGYSRKISGNMESGVELYYKDLRNVVCYKDGTTIFQNSLHWEDQLIQGRGYSYGLEVFGRGKYGPFSASLAYTLSWSWRQFDSMNLGAPFPYRFDRRHNLRTELIYQKNPRFNAIASWVFMNGEAITLPDQLYPDFDNSVLGNPGNSGFTYNYSNRNNYRLPPIHRLDLAINFIRRRGAHFERTWTLGLYNAYGRKNVMAVELREQAPGVYSLYGLSFLRCIPTLSYSVKF